MWQDNPCKLMQYICSYWTVELDITSWYGYDFRITGPLRDNLLVTDGFLSHRANIPEYAVSLDKLLYKQSSCQWFETPQCFRDVTIMTVWTFLQKHLKHTETHEIILIHSKISTAQVLRLGDFIPHFAMVVIIFHARIYVEPC